MGRLFEMSLRKPLRIRRGGGRVVWGGDACVALAGGECAGMRNASLRVITYGIV
jgi:hypothetical protein